MQYTTRVRAFEWCEPTEESVGAAPLSPPRRGTGRRARVVREQRPVHERPNGQAPAPAGRWLYASHPAAVGEAGPPVSGAAILPSRPDAA